MQDWWHYKIPPLLAVAFATAICFHVSIHVIIMPLTLLLLSLITGAVYVSVLNDLTDMEEDFISGKRNGMAKRSLIQRILIFVSILLCGIFFIWYFRHDKLSMTVYLLSWIAFSLYSIPPLRLKTKGVSGVIADAAGSSLFPCLLMVSGVTHVLQQHIDSTWFIAVAVWSFTFGLRGILWHQFSDRPHDLLSGTCTFASKINPLIFRIQSILLTTIELVALGLMLYQLASWIVLLFLGLYGVLTLVRKVFFKSALILIIAPEAGKYQIFMNEFYQVFFPLALLVQAAYEDVANGITLCIYCLLFSQKIMIVFRDFYRFLETVFRKNYEHAE